MHTIENYPSLKKIVDIISGQNPFQRKKITSYMQRQDETYWAFCIELMEMLDSSFLKNEQDWLEAATSYNKMCGDFLREQIQFRKTGVYPVADQSTAYREVYSQETVMRYYMVGLLLSYMFWPNHYAMMRFYIDTLQDIEIENYLDIAPGHGMFTVQAMRRSPQLTATLVDISATSIKVTTELLSAFEIDQHKIDFIENDFMNVSVPAEQFDFITMGEIIEHVDNAPEFMRKARNLLKPQGRIFMTTCANCPSIDHVYHFHDVCEIREAIHDAGLEVDHEIALPADDIPSERWQEELTTINYAAVLKAS